jgi:hypothetical protein
MFNFRLGIVFLVICVMLLVGFEVFGAVGERYGISIEIWIFSHVL